jgi:hypothetical protein
MAGANSLSAFYTVPMRKLAICLSVLLLSPSAAAQSLRGETVYRMTLLRAAPGRLLDLVAALRSNSALAPSAKSLLLRHAQGDHWDLMLLAPSEPAALLAPVADEALVAWQEDEIVRGPDLAKLDAFSGATLFHAEMFHSLPGKRAELLKEREMENAYLHALGRPTNAIFVRGSGASWDSFTLGAYRSWKHYAERDDIPREKSAEAARTAGFQNEEQIGPYLRSLILDHHDSLLTRVK